MNLRALILPCVLLLSSLAFAEDTNQASKEEQYQAWANSILQSIQPQNGHIQLPDAVASLNIPDGFYYLSPEDAETVLVDVWGNQPGQNTLGMILPSHSTPFDAETWGVTIRYEEDGYVSDEDANDIDYGELMKQMKADIREESKQRVQDGYEAIELIGWAAPPYYNAQTHKLYWAKELKFGNYEQHTLNYNIRVLGRKGVLVLNFIAGMNQKALIESELDTVLAMAEFDNGAKYTDFDINTDTVAAYGIGALVAGKIAAKTGLFAALFIFLKKFGVLILVGLGGLLKKLFTSKKQKVTTQ